MHATIECGSHLNWADINPDIFGSMIQAVVHPDQRGGMGMHYTSVTNIMKVIEPLFLDELNEEFEKHSDDARKLQKLIERLRSIRVFDPACGSGNFLIIAYKELRKLEIELYKRLQEISDQKTLPISGITLSQFFGIELDDFAHEIAILSLWLAEHQMNVAFKKTLGHARPSLPLKEGGKIIRGNAARMDWESVCAKTTDTKVYILGNPPYLGSRHQEAEHKADIQTACHDLPQPKKLDYIACWFVKAASYIARSTAECGFVSTNSISQGEQVSLLWPFILDLGIEIKFAHQAFKWTNNAKANAGVICVVIGLASGPIKEKVIFKDGVRRSVANINPYLSSARNVIVYQRRTPISRLPRMDSGNKATDGGNLFLSATEKQFLENALPNATQIIRKAFGAEEFINGKDRWCLWIRDSDLPLANAVPFIRERIALVRQSRLESRDEGAHALASRPHQFREMKTSQRHSLIIPTVSSERREYIPVGYLGPDDVIIAPNNAIYDPDPYVVGIISSRIHMTWVRAVAGRMKTDFRYSSVLCYNTFPMPSLSSRQIEMINSAVFAILDERENCSDQTMAELYDPKKMPDRLKQAHRHLDDVMDGCYRAKPFGTDEERLDHLFALYEEMSGVSKQEVAYA